MRVMYDSVNASAIPANAAMVAGYVDGRYAWSQKDWDRFPNAVRVTISAVGAAVAMVGDVERGCIWPVANAVPWVLRARAAGYDPTIYVNELNDWRPCREAFRAAGVPEPHWWVANYDGRQTIPAGAVAKQYAHPHDGDGVADRPWETGGHYDLSVVADYWPGVDGQGDDDMLTSEQATQLATMHQVLVSGALRNVKLNQDLGFVRESLLAEIGGVKALLATVVAEQKDDLSDTDVLARLDAKLDAQWAEFEQRLEEARAADRAAMEDAVRDVLGNDNTDQADRLLDALAARISGGTTPKGS
ncbi:hypothetical protein [Saccharothrix texasensis]|uniref:Uncharacterized protein n=1 Tax=Saccharothrix texasensis TaxID=103734 RepID=A0A3N1H1A7_9PSEU|nr:hypothetical protein [Saccharothrix texasensis]ROP36297.1 hypothetical protein EDD40_1562 [Saccharothrix texasensis]